MMMMMKRGIKRDLSVFTKTSSYQIFMAHSLRVTEVSLENIACGHHLLTQLVPVMVQVIIFISFGSNHRLYYKTWLRGQTI